MQGVGAVAMTSGAGLHGVSGEVQASAGVPEVAPATTTGMRRNATSAPNLNDIPADQSAKEPNSEIAATTQNIISAENANNVLPPEQADKPISQKIDDLAAGLKRVEAAIRGNRTIPWDVKVQEDGPIAVNAAQISSPEQAPQAILREGFHNIWYRPEAQKAWKYLRSKLTPEELTEELNRRKTASLTPIFENALCIRKRSFGSSSTINITGFRNSTLFEKHERFRVRKIYFHRTKQAIMQIARPSRLNPRSAAFATPVYSSGFWPGIVKCEPKKVK
jgi:hypothetical protein